MATPEITRPEALRLAVQLHASQDHGFPFDRRSITERVIETAGQFSAWLLAAPARLVLRAAPFTFEQGPPGPGTPTRHHQTGGTVSVTMTDSQQVTYTVEPEDSKGFAVSDTITWSSDDAGAVLTVTVSDDGLSATFAAVAPGTATISATDGTLSASDLITVTAGGVASLVLTPGTPADEPAA